MVQAGRSSKILAWTLVVLSIATGAGDILLSLKRSPTAVEAALVRFISLALGIVGAYVFGRQSAREAARELIQPHARSAFRRVFGMYSSLARLAEWIVKFQKSPPSPAALDTLQALVTEQILTASDALEDWRDIIPEDVKELEARVRVVEIAPMEFSDE